MTKYLQIIFKFTLSALKSVLLYQTYIIMPLTVSGEKIPEVNGDGGPELVYKGVSVAPDTDIHGASSRL